MTENSQNYPHTAISTWSGFVYQGKLALYHCLRLMTSDYEGNRGLRLQLESQDDFAIYQGEQCLSLHQVKAYKDKLFSKYQSGINTQKQSAAERRIGKAYFHVAREISNLPESFEQDYHPVKLYSYPIFPGAEEGIIKKCCPLDEVDRHLEEQIKKLIATVGSLSPWKRNICTFIRETLEALVNTKVISVHHKIHQPGRNQTIIAAREFIEFSAFYQILEADAYDVFETEDYFLSRLQIDIGLYYQEFCELHDTLSPAIQTKLDDYLAAITAIDIQGMKDFLRATMPHRKGRFRTLSEFKDQAFDRESMRHGLFAIFRKLVKAKELAGREIQFAWQAEGQFYYPTGIHTAAEHKDEICHDILQQALAEDVECLFEGGALITSAINTPSITHVKPDADAIAMEDEMTRSNSISSFQQVALVALNHVPESLNDEEVD